MRNKYTKSIFQSILVPVINECNNQSALFAARSLIGAGTIYLAGIVGIPEKESLSAGAEPVRQLRKAIRGLTQEGQVNEVQVHATHAPWDELLRIVKHYSPELLVLDWPCQLTNLGISPADVLESVPCNVALVRGPFPEKPRRILVSLRGGPYAELSLRIGLAISRARQVPMTVLHLKPLEGNSAVEAAFKGIDRILSYLPDVQRLELFADDFPSAIRETASEYDAVILGASALPDYPGGPFGPVVETFLKKSPVSAIIVKSQRPMPPDLGSETSGQTAISVLVDKWFAENTYHTNEFTDLDYLLAIKKRQDLTISLALPALNEEKTVGEVISSIQNSLMKKYPLIDEMVLMDSDSTDQTRSIAESLGVPVYIHQQILPQYGARYGKGEALWKSLFVTRGELLLWIDTDIVNIQPHFVYGLAGVLLNNPQVQFVKGFYRRPLKVGDKMQASGGGRVTELTARPLLNLFYPELSGIVQPLSGEYGGRRAALEQLPFFSGYGVEIGLLIDVLERFGLHAVAQVDLQERVHHNQPLESLSKMSFAIIQAVIHKLEQRYGRDLVEDVNRTMKLIHYKQGHLFLEVEEIAEQSRPPIIELQEYREKLSHLGSA